MIRILLVVIAMVAYGSLYPWQYRPSPPGLTPVDVLLHSWPGKIGPDDLADILVNLLIYVPVGLFAFMALHRRGHRWLRFFIPGLLAFAISTAIELAQVHDITRFSSLLDVLDNTLGGLLGTGVGFVFRDLLSGAIFLVFHWVGFQICVLFALLARNVKPRFWNSKLEAFTELACWTVFLCLLSEPRRRSRWAIGLATGFLLLIVVRGFAPFHFIARAQTFSAIPFLSVLTTEWIVGFPVYLRKSFEYGASIWLLRQAGLRLTSATLLVATLLAGIEVAQIYLPGRTPESTDPVLALILGLVIHLIEEARRVPETPVIAG